MWTNLSSGSLPLARFNTSGSTENSDCVVRCEILYYSWCQSVSHSLFFLIHLHHSRCRLCSGMIRRTETVKFLTCILVVYGSKLDRDINYPGWYLFQFLQANARIGAHIKWDHERFFSYPFPFIVYHLPIIPLAVGKTLICS